MSSVSTKIRQPLVKGLFVSSCLMFSGHILASSGTLENRASFGQATQVEASLLSVGLLAVSTVVTAYQVDAQINSNPNTALASDNAVAEPVASVRVGVPTPEKTVGFNYNIVNNASKRDSVVAGQTMLTYPVQAMQGVNLQNRGVTVQYASAQIPTNASQQMAYYQQVGRKGGTTRSNSTEMIAKSALSRIGIRYKYGGNSAKEGFDCSSLVLDSVGRATGVRLPRTAAQQYAVSTKIPVERAMRGDLVFFKTRGRRISHVGIYLGDNQFVHAPRTGKRIQKAQISGYWRNRFAGFGRIPGACKVPAYYGGLKTTAGRV